MMQIRIELALMARQVKRRSRTARLSHVKIPVELYALPVILGSAILVSIVLTL